MNEWPSPHCHFCDTELNRAYMLDLNGRADGRIEKRFDFRSEYQIYSATRIVVHKKGDDSSSRSYYMCQACVNESLEEAYQQKEK